MRSLSWLGWAALTSAAGIIYLVLALVPGPAPGPQLADLTVAGEESETPTEPDGPKLEPVEFIDLAQVPHEPFPNSAEPPLAAPIWQTSTFVFNQGRSRPQLLASASASSARSRMSLTFIKPPQPVSKTMTVSVPPS